MIPQPAKTTWIWITATPLLLMVLLLVTELINLQINALYYGWVFAFGLSILIGVVALVKLLSLRAKHKIQFSQRTLWIPLVLACLDIALPLTFILFLFYALRSMHF